ncbi:MAG: hypothetical protein ACOYU7_08745 [Bacillota bacterium]|uniref:hypothetical protein n=1 Tax=Desulforudis sp. DRI-14 TaxID=3459793 RepID=UPI00348C18A5
MACVNPDGAVTRPGKLILQALVEGAATPEEAAEVSNIPVYRVRSGLREMAQAGYIQEENGRYTITDLGRARLR